MKLLLVMVVGVVFVYFGHRRWRNRGGEGVESELLRADVLREGGGIGFIQGAIREGEDSLMMMMMIIVGHRRIGTTSCLIGQN